MSSRRRSHSPRKNHGQPDAVSAAGGENPREGRSDHKPYDQMSRDELIRELEEAAGPDSKGKLIEDLRVHQEELRAQTAELYAAQNDAKRSDERYAELYDFAPVAYATLDVYGVIREINLTGATLLKNDRGHLIGLPLLHFVPSDDRQVLHDHLRRCRDASEQYVTTRLRLQPPHTAPLPVQLTSRPGRRGGTSLHQTIIADLTEIEAAEERLRETERHLNHAQRLASLGTLAAGIAHEIRNPLNSILMSAEYAREVELPRDETMETLDQIVKETKRCGEIVRGLLSFARQETSGQTCADINAAVRQAVRVAQNEDSKTAGEIYLHLAPALPPATISAVEFQQVVVNLVRNAIQAARGRVRVRVSTLRVSEGIRLEVADNGPGIPPELITRIFDPFYSTRQHEGGTGLGLSIVHTILTQCGGKISVASQLGKGSTFTVLLAAARDS